MASGSVLGFFYGLDPDTVARYAGEIATSQIAHAGFFFTLAAWIHANTVKKEIATQFNSVTEAINNVAIALRLDLSAQGDRIGGLETGLGKLSSRVDTLEQHKTEEPK